jgi:hypothetical protein
MDAFGDPIQQTLGTVEPHLTSGIDSWLVRKRQFNGLNPRLERLKHVTMRTPETDHTRLVAP